MIHNHNWHTSGGWPETQSGQCTIGGIYGSGSVKKGYTLKNVFVETAASCAIGLEISKSAYNRHPTQEGCVGSIVDMEIDGIFFDEDFKTGTGYGNFISGEPNPYAACTGDLSGKVENLKISSNVVGEALTLSDFTIPASSTVPGLQLSKATDPLSAGDWKLYSDMNANIGGGATFEIDSQGVEVRGADQCIERCHSDLSCDCAVYHKSTKLCWKKRGCTDSTSFVSASSFDVYVRQGGEESDQGEEAKDGGAEVV